METHDLPVDDAQRMLDAGELADMVTPATPDVVVIEKVHAYPGQGAVSTFKFGAAFGICIGVIAALRVQIHYVTPQRWKTDLGLSHPPPHVRKSKASAWRKAAAMDLARELYPEAAGAWKRVRDHNRAEAALLAHWGALNRVGLS